ncbi:MAG: ATPase [Deltaproteobacteria bacterium]|nr:MAG: ATPase [Deltaproteobacteria bacterium]
MEEKEHYAQNVIVAEPGSQVATLTRVFDAPPERLFKAYTDPDLVPRWWGPASLTTKIDKMDARTGGSWRFVQRDPEGNEYAFHGVYHEVSPNRIVQTFEYEGMPGHVMFQVMTLEKIDGKTKMTDKSFAESVEDLEGMLKEGMMEGWVESVERLALLVGKK